MIRSFLKLICKFFFWHTKASCIKVCLTKFSYQCKLPDIYAQRHIIIKSTFLYSFKDDLCISCHWFPLCLSLSLPFFANCLLCSPNSISLQRQMNNSFRTAWKTSFYFQMTNKSGLISLLTNLNWRENSWNVKNQILCRLFTRARLWIESTLAELSNDQAHFMNHWISHLAAGWRITHCWHTHTRTHHLESGN